MLAFLAGALVFVAAAIAAALAILLPGGGRGLDVPVALAALVVGGLAGLGAWFHTRRLPANRRGGLGGDGGAGGRISPWAWVLFTVFALFALRSFCWLVYYEDNKVVIGSPNNLGDISLHMLLARDFANGVHWWPEHPQAAGQPMRYYPGVDLFQSLLLVLGADDFPALVWVGLGGSLLTLLALYRWGGSFTVAGFLFSGGLAGFQWFQTGRLADFQADMAWKSLPLAMFVTQRPWLFALPAGLLLLAHWREKFFTDPPLVPVAPVAAAASEAEPPRPPDPEPWGRRGLLPFWVELLLYAVMPVCHLFAFLFLSVLLGWWFVGYFTRQPMRWHLLRLVGAALVPATAQVWLMTGHFSAASSTIRLAPGWMQHDLPFVRFWIMNFGLFALLTPVLWLLCAWDAGRVGRAWLIPPTSLPGGGGRKAVFPLGRDEEAAAAFVLPAGVLFLVACVVMFAPWEWDNTKVMIWCYLAALPFLWQRMVRPLAAPLRWVLCALMFFSGAVSLAGGLGRANLGYLLIERAELDSVRGMVGGLPVEARFAAAPDYNHPLVYGGRKVAMGYDGHLYSQGIDYKPLLRDLDTLMLGRPGWEQAAADLGVRYVFWGPREQRRWPTSARPWAEGGTPVASVEKWGTIYEIKTK